MAEISGVNSGHSHLIPHQWKPGGPSPNPGGRPKGLSSYIREKTLDGRDLVDFLDSVMRGGEKVFCKMSDRLKAVEMLLAYGLWPKVGAVDPSGGEIKPLLDLSKLTDDELKFIENVRLGLITIHERIRGGEAPPSPQ